jgi:hypothetical protein
MKPWYYMYHDSETNHRTKDCPFSLKPTQPLHQPPPREVNHTMHWTPNHQQYSPSPPSLFSPQTHQRNQAHPITYYQSYHYATTIHPSPLPAPQITYPLPAPQITYSPAVQQITYPAQNSTNHQVKDEANLPPPPLPQLQEHQQQTEAFPIHDTILTITRGSNTNFDTKR